MKTIQIAKQFIIGQMGDAFIAAGFGSNIISIMGNDTPSGISTAGKVVYDGVPSDAQIQAVIDAYSVQQTQQQKFEAVKNSALFNDASWAAFTNAQKADSLRSWMQKIVKYELNESL